MFCTNCGKKIADDSQFCEFCGAKIELDNNSEPSKPKKVTKETVSEKPKDTSAKSTPSANNTSSMANPTPKKPMSKKTKIGLFAGIGVAVVAVIVMIVVAVTPRTVKMDKYIVIESSGYDGYGKVSAYIDWDAFSAEYGNKVVFNKQAQQDSFGLSNFFNPADMLKLRIRLEKSSFDYLSNGDVITINVELDEDIYTYVKNKFTGLSVTYPISGLAELTKIDLLSTLNEPYVKFSGPNGKTYASPNYKSIAEGTYTDGDLNISLVKSYNSKSINIVKDNQLLSSVEYVIEEEGPFVNGDVVTLKLANVDSLIEKGYGPKEDNIKVTVADRPEILADTSILAEDSVKGFVSTYVYRLNEHEGYEPYSSKCYKNEKSSSAFAMIAKPSTVTDSPASVLIDYEYDYAYLDYRDSERTIKHGGLLILHNVYVDGVSLDCDDYDIRTGYYDIWSYIREYEDKYDFIQLY